MRKKNFCQNFCFQKSKIFFTDPSKVKKFLQLSFEKKKRKKERKPLEKLFISNSIWNMDMEKWYVYATFNIGSFNELTIYQPNQNGFPSLCVSRIDSWGAHWKWRSCNLRLALDWPTRPIIGILIWHYGIARMRETSTPIAIIMHQNI